jgi:hypothetical protein
MDLLGDAMSLRNRIPEWARRQLKANYPRGGHGVPPLQFFSRWGTGTAKPEFRV